MARKTGFDYEPQNDTYEADNIFEYKAFSSSSNGNAIFNSIALLTVPVLKLAGFQISLFLRLCTFPIQAFNFCVVFVIFPFQVVTYLRDHVKKKIKSLVVVICDPLRPHKPALKMAVRFSRAVFWAAYVFFVLLGLLVSGFVIGGFIMRNLVQESVHTTEPLNFDYTKINPVAIVPLDNGMLPSRLKLTVSLTLPESEYNRKLGIFQVRVEALSDDGEVSHGSSYPTMLRFKSQPVRAFEMLFNSVHLMAGLKSEVQNLKIVLGEFNAGHAPTTNFKVILEQRAEFRDGLGVPEIYSGSLEIESKLPKLKRVLWDWRRTLSVWIGLGSFMAETMVFLIFFRGVVLPCGRRSKAVDSKRKCWPDKITWHKAAV